MRRKMMMCGVVLVLGLLALGCGDAGGSVIAANPYTEKTWSWPNGDEVTFTTDSEWLRTNSNGSQAQGTYTYSNNAIILETTDQRSNSNAQWTDATGEQTVTVADRTMVTETGEILTLKDAGPVSGGPYVGSAWTGTPSNTGNGITVLIFPTDSSWLMVHTGLDGQVRRGNYTYSQSNNTITLNWTSNSKDFGATWTSLPSANMDGTVSGYSNMTLFINGGNTTFIKQ